MADNETDGNSSMRSSMISRSSVGFMKAMEGRAKKGNMNKLLGISFSVVITFLIFMGILVYFFTTNLTGFALNNQKYFAAAHNLVRLDSLFRRNANLLSVEIITTYQIAVTSYIVKVYPPAFAAYYRILMLRDYACTVEAYGTKNFMDILVNRRQRLNDRWSLYLNEYTLQMNDLVESSRSSEFASLLMDVKGKLSMNHFTLLKFKLNSSDHSNSVSYVNFLREFKNKADLQLNFMKQLRPVMNDKEPPFAVGLPLVMLIVNALTEVLGNIQNIFEGTMSGVDRAIRNLETLILTTNYQVYYTNGIGISFGLLGLVIIFFGLVITCCKLINDYLNTLLVTYQMIKHEELVMNREAYEARRDHLAENSFNEANLVDDALGVAVMNKSVAAMTSGQLLEHTSGKGSKKKQLRKTKTKMAKDFYYSSSKMFFGFGIFFNCGRYQLFLHDFWSGIQDRG
jgi:hypothetical protein